MFHFTSNPFGNKVEIIRKGILYPNEKSVCKIKITQPTGIVGSIDLSRYDNIDFTIGNEMDEFEIQLAKYLEDLAPGEKSTFLFRIRNKTEVYTIELKSFIPGKPLRYWTHQEIYDYTLFLHGKGKHFYQTNYQWALLYFEKARENLYLLNFPNKPNTDTLESNPLVSAHKAIELRIMLDTNITICLTKLRRWDQCLNLLEPLLVQVPNNEKVLYLYGLVLKKLFLFDDSFSVFATLLSKYPSNAAAIRQLNSVRRKLQLGVF